MENTEQECYVSQVTSTEIITAAYDDLWCAFPCPEIEAEQNA